MSDDRDDLPTDRIDDDDFGEEIVGGDQFDTQIADDKFTDVIDNGAMSQIVDRVNQSPFEDDFVAAERVREQSQLGPDGRPVDEFDAKFQQANAEQTALDQQAPFVRTNPVSITKGILGSQVPITAPGVNEGEPIYSERKQIALWGGDDAETTAVTVTFGPVGQPGVTAQSGVQPVGIVKWGTRGFLMEAEIDILLGAQFTVCASYVVLEGMMAGPAGALNTFNFTGMVSTAPCVRTAPLTRTLYWNILAGAANTGYLRIPAFAKNLIIFRTGAVVGDFTISIADLAESEIYRHIVSAAANMTIPLPLAGSAATFRVTNNSGTNGDYVFIFELGL